MKVFVLPLLELLILFFGAVSTNQGFALSKTISVYTWWEYVPSEVITKLKSKGFKVNIIEYRSNEVALSKLLSGNSDYDIAIVSNWVLRVLEDANKVEAKALESVLQKRKYLDFTTSFSKSCVPYMWSTTVFAADAKSLKEGPRSIKALLALQSRSYTVGIVDDPFEFAARVVSDNKEKCPNGDKEENIFDLIDRCPAEKLLEAHGELDRGLFRNTLEPILGGNAAIYGWHGEVGGQIGSLPTFEFYLPKGNPVVGLDYVCVLKGRKDASLPSFVELLTDEESTNFNVAKTPGRRFDMESKLMPKKFFENLELKSFFF
ncbi:MAG: hypothetical protein IPK04_18965 [Bdellovibrionales bacterium]|nr:hypothetical protein [Bdellovibrionales bacterium]